MEATARWGRSLATSRVALAAAASSAAAEALRATLVIPVASAATPTSIVLLRSVAQQLKVVLAVNMVMVLERLLTVVTLAASAPAVPRTRLSCRAHSLRQVLAPVAVAPTVLVAERAARLAVARTPQVVAEAVPTPVAALAVSEEQTLDSPIPRSQDFLATQHWKPRLLRLLTTSMMKTHV